MPPDNHPRSFPDLWHLSSPAQAWPEALTWLCSQEEEQERLLKAAEQEQQREQEWLQAER